MQPTTWRIEHIEHIAGALDHRLGKPNRGTARGACVEALGRAIPQDGKVSYEARRFEDDEPLEWVEMPGGAEVLTGAGSGLPKR